MPTITCPTCKKTDKVPDKFIGARLKCKVCGTSIVVTAQGAEAVPAPSPAAPAAAPTPAAAPAAAVKAASSSTFSGIEVEGLDSTAWSTVSEPSGTSAEPAEAARADQSMEDSSQHLEIVPRERPPGTKEYKLLTSKDKFFANKFDLQKLEEALNAYARQGWVVRSMATPQIAGFSGGPREELVVLLER